MVTFQKSLAAALLSGAVAFMTPVLLHAQTTSAPSGAQPANGASQAAGANAAGAANTANSPNGTSPATTTNGTYGGMGNDQSTTAPKHKPVKSTTPGDMNTQQNNSTTTPHQ